MILFLRFVLGLAIGSFVNVVALRYDPDRFLFANGTIGGRSHCPHCKRTLRWFELVPLLSFLVLRGHCRTCRARLSPRYFLVELGMGLLFIAPIPVPVELLFYPAAAIAVQAIWIAVLATLFLMALIDLRFKIIPDEIHVILLVLGAALILLIRPAFADGHGSFVSGYALLFGLQTNIWINHLAAALIGAGFFALLIFVTPFIFGQAGMGVGDAKLALALGFLFGWPDIALIVMLAFVIGAVFGAFILAGKSGSLKYAVPFGPFLALAALIVMLFGNQLLGGYFGLFGWQF
jgi:prepilin signal peptidase PulO-like enzyme (type II secretory pathway)